MKSAAARKVVSITDRRRRRDIDLFIEDFLRQPHRPHKADSNAAAIRELAIEAIKRSREGSLTLAEIQNAVEHSVQFKIRGEYFLASLISDMKNTKLAIVGGRVFLL